VHLCMMTRKDVTKLENQRIGSKIEEDQSESLED